VSVNNVSVTDGSRSLTWPWGAEEPGGWADSGESDLDTQNRLQAAVA
jgi:hypothetical protein